PAYFGVDVAKNGSIQHSGNGWVGYRSQDLADLISRAHKAGIRVVLTIKAFNQDTIHAVAADAATRGLLVQNVIDATRAKNFDGVNIDFEGLGNTDRALFTTLARTLADGLRAADPAWQVTLDSYVSSAADSGQGFFDVGAIAPTIDSFFIMGYDMYQRSTASPNAPLPSYGSAIAAYLRAVPASKIVLGAPFYGYDWPTQDNSLHSPATGTPTPVTYEEIVAAGHPTVGPRAEAVVVADAQAVIDSDHEAAADPAAVALGAPGPISSPMRRTPHDAPTPPPYGGFT